MLLDFSLENYGPFRDRVTLSLQTTKHSEHPGNVIVCDAVKGGILSCATVFGPNASGKSYIFKAMAALRMAVFDAYPEGTEFPWYDPFRINDVNPKMPVKFEIHLAEGGVIYDYVISFDSKRVVSESLSYRPCGRPKVVFRRGSDKDVFTGKQKKMKDFLTDSTAFLVIGAKYNDEICALVRNSILGIITLESEDAMALVEHTCEWAGQDLKRRSMLIDGLRKADFAVSDFEISNRIVEKASMRPNIPPVLYDSIPADKEGNVRVSSVRLIHGYPSSDGLSVAFDMNQESTGTRSMFGLMGPLIDALSNGRTVFIDEFGAHLHPLLTRWLVSQFSHENNPNGAQLIVITHDLGLIDTKELLRRDQIFFTDKNRDDGSSTLYCLSDFKGIRKDELVLKSYLMGRYDAIPDIFSRGLMDVRKK